MGYWDLTDAKLADCIKAAEDRAMRLRLEYDSSLIVLSKIQAEVVHRHLIACGGDFGRRPVLFDFYESGPVMVIVEKVESGYGFEGNIVVRQLKADGKPFKNTNTFPVSYLKHFKPIPKEPS